VRILYLIDHDIRPIIRKDQADGEERSEAILNIENQTRAWQQNLTQAWTQPTDAAKALSYENDNRGQTYLERYAGLELLQRERKIQKEIRALWLANSDLARKSYVEEGMVNQMEKATDGTREQVITALNQFLPAMPPGELEAKKQSLLRTMKLRFAAAFGIGLLGLGALITIALTAYRLPKARPVIADGVFRVPPAQDRPHPEELTLEMDLQGNITKWSLDAETLYGYTADDMRGQTIGKLFESESEIGRLGRELQAAKQATFQTTHKTQAGASIRVRIEFRPLSDNAIGLICTRR
jgi:PAS domain S-box-containing protein